MQQSNHHLSNSAAKRNDLKDNFFDSMDEVTMQRELKIKTELKQEKIRIKQFKENLKKQQLEQQE